MTKTARIARTSQQRGARHDQDRPHRSHVSELVVAQLLLTRSMVSSRATSQFAHEGLPGDRGPFFFAPRHLTRITQEHHPSSQKGTRHV